jgi:glutamine amidotransferase/cyclase
MMHHLESKGFAGPLRQYLAANRPFLGICLGLQALFEHSDESPGVPGLGVLRGRVQRFAVDLAVPHIGWNGFRAVQPSPLLAGLRGDEKLYFVHAYHVVPDDESLTLTTTDYGCRFTSSIQRGNLLATQFHPEKSGPVGLQMLENFLRRAPAAQPPGDLSGRTELAKRIIACLDVRADDQGDLVVTKGDRYDVREQGAVRNLGNPVDLARRYYAEGADEITFLNITGFRHFPLGDLPMLEVLRQTCRDVFVPLTIGGGIRDYTDEAGRHYTALEVASEYFRSGADKVSIGSEVVLTVEEAVAHGRATRQTSVEQIARVYGSQAVVVSIDPRRVYVARPEQVPHQVIETALPGPQGENYCWYQCTIQGGRQGRELDAITLAQACEQLGAGEILLNCIDRDGTRSGFDIELVDAIKRAVTIPVIASSGAGTAKHFAEVFLSTHVEAVLAAGVFHRGEVSISAVKRHLAGKLPVRT